MYFDTRKLKRYVKGPQDWTNTAQEHDMLINLFKKYELNLGEWGINHECEEENCDSFNRRGVFFTFSESYPEHAQLYELKRELLALPFVKDHEEKLKTIYISWCPYCGVYEFQFIPLENVKK